MHQVRESTSSPLCDFHKSKVTLSSWGVFRLTDPPGKQSVQDCKQKGVFHPHEVENIYTDALRPGHVYEAKGLEFEVVDLRSNR